MKNKIDIVFGRNVDILCILFNMDCGKKKSGLGIAVGRKIVVSGLRFGTELLRPTGSYLSII